MDCLLARRGLKLHKQWARKRRKKREERESWASTCYWVLQSPRQKKAARKLSIPLETIGCSTERKKHFIQRAKLRFWSVFLQCYDWPLGFLFSPINTFSFQNVNFSTFSIDSYNLGFTTADYLVKRKAGKKEFSTLSTLSLAVLRYCAAVEGRLGGGK